MDIDIAALRALEREKDIPLDLLVRTIEQALLLAYHRTEGALPHARVELDRELGPRRRLGAGARRRPAQVVREWDDTPEGFGRIAATTARQMILQRLRDAEDEQVLGEFRGREGDIVSGVVQQSRDPRMVHVDLGTVEAVLPPAEQVPGERYVHGARLRCYVVGVRKGLKGPSITVSRTHPNLVRKLFALEVPGDRRRHRRDRGARARGRAPVEGGGAGDGGRGERQGRLHRADGPAGARGDGRAARREDRHRRPQRRPGRRSSPARCRRRGCRRWRSWTPRSARRGSSCPTTSSRSRSARRGRTPGSPPSSPAGGSTSAPDTAPDDPTAEPVQGPPRSGLRQAPRPDDGHGGGRGGPGGGGPGAGRRPPAGSGGARPGSLGPVR